MQPVELPTSGSTCTRAHTGRDTIQFSVTGTIGLTSTLPEITDSQLTIKGLASPGITIDGGHAVQVMQVVSGAVLNLKNLTIANGLAVPNGGGILNEGMLTVSNTAFSGNKSTLSSCADIAEGGAIYNGGTTTVNNSTFSSNRSLGSAQAFVECTEGGAIYNGGRMTVTNSTFANNDVRQAAPSIPSAKEAELSMPEP
jgi:hypothetical protein